jgi:hypothetical protein
MAALEKTLQIYDLAPFAADHLAAGRFSSLTHVYPSPSHVRGHTAPSCGAAYALEGLFRDHIIGGEDYARD